MTPVELEAALKELGASTLAVATTLADGGYRGQAGNVSLCPIARYLQRRFKLAPCNVYVTPQVALVIENGEEVSVRPSLQVAEFILRFDSGDTFGGLKLTGGAS